MIKLDKEMFYLSASDETTSAKALIARRAVRLVRRTKDHAIVNVNTYERGGKGRYGGYYGNKLENIIGIVEVQYATPRAR